MSDVELDIERLLTNFFGEGNAAWPGMDPSYRWLSRVVPFVDNARRRQHGPLVLPRMSYNRNLFVLYVIVPDPRETVFVTELIRSFAGPTLIEDFDRAIVPVQPDQRDVVERGIAAAAPRASLLKLQAASSNELRKELTDSMFSMLNMIAQRPRRELRQRKPIGRLLAEFDAALASGATDASLEILQQIDKLGGITATNLAALKIRRLDKLGHSRALLDYDGLVDVLLQHVSGTVYESVLNALWTEFVEDPVSRGDVDNALATLSASPLALRRFVDIDYSGFGSYALSVIALLAIHFEVERALTDVSSILLDPSSTAIVPPAIHSLLRVEGIDDEGRTSAPSPAAEQGPAPAATVGSWTELFHRLDTFDPAHLPLEEFTSWPSPAADDAALADSFDRLGDKHADIAWSLVGPFLESIGYSEAAPLSARALIRNAIAFDRFSPGDLATIAALLDIALRSGMKQVDYVDLLLELQSSYEQWSSPGNAPLVLDLIDRLAMSACPDEDARRNFTTTVFSPLLRHLPRLYNVDRTFAARLSTEIGLDLDWSLHTTATDAVEPDQSPLAAQRVLLYSLDEGVLSRCAEQLVQTFASLRVAISHDHVGGPQLKEKIRNADIVVIATRCAKHAATGFIGKYAESSKIFYAQGSGSASLLRATYEALEAVTP
ncbi:protein DpdD [Rhodococcus koreensis]